MAGNHSFEMVEGPKPKIEILESFVLIWALTLIKVKGAGIDATDLFNEVHR